MSYSAQDVATLRKSTGAGMLDCKNALVETDGDMELAKDWLRKKGISSAAKRAGRAADQGTIDVLVDGNIAAYAEVNCETDFVAKGEVFTTFVKEVTFLVAKQGVDKFEGLTFKESTVADEIITLGALVGENVGLGRIEKFETKTGVVDAYKHMQAGRGTIGVLIQLEGVEDNEKSREVAHDIALHAASAAPRFISRDEVPAEVVERERGVFLELTKNEGKPEVAWDKIVEGRLTGFFKESCLLEQSFVKDNKVTIKELVATLGEEATIANFSRIKIGEE
jgi:elongation factor Ts